MRLEKEAKLFKMFWPWCSSFNNINENKNKLEKRLMTSNEEKSQYKDTRLFQIENRHLANWLLLLQ